MNFLDKTDSNSVEVEGAVVSMNSIEFETDLNKLTLGTEEMIGLITFPKEVMLTFKIKPHVFYLMYLYFFNPE